ncbi:SBBP repeat-containing protein [Chryseobacterium kwangjuense]|uniref:SBBP repeat-containing protein n=1 Tax=Chryseobacterium kwangjuense TaxID=267125 RepID=A0ABW9K6T1_9FLAO
MKKITLLFILTLSPFLAYSQNTYLPDYNWGGNIGGTGAERANHIATDIYGDVIVAGKFLSNSDFDISSGTHYVPNSGYFDAYISKYSANGSLTWVKSFAANDSSNGYPFINSMATDSSGNIYVTGLFRGSIDFDPSPTGSKILTSNGETDIFIVKLDRNGILVWAGSIGSASGDQGIGISVDSMDHVYVTGSFRGTIDFDITPGILNLTSEAFDSAFIIKLDKNANMIWGKATQGAGVSEGTSIAVDSNFNVFVTGNNRGINDYDPSPTATFNLTSPMEGQVYIMKLDSNGNFLNAGVTTPTNTVYPARAYKVKIDSNNNVVIAGTFYGTIDFDFGSANNPMTAMGAGCCNDAYVLKVDNNLNYIWSKRLGSYVPDSAYGLAIDQNNNILTTGFMVGITVNDFSGLNEDEAFIWALDPAGNQIDLEDFVGNGDDQGEAIEVDKAGNVYVAGTFNYNLKDRTFFNFVSNGESDGFLVKLGNTPHPAPVNLPPTAVQDLFTATGNGSQTFNVVSNDQGVSGTYSLRIVSAPLNGTLTVNNNGTVTYTPNGSTLVNDSFQYSVENSNGLVSNVATAKITNGSLAVQETEADQKLSVYPNPADSVLYIRSSSEITSVIVFDMAGSKLIELKGQTKIDVSKLTTGNYILSAKMKNGETLRHTFIKK